MGIVNREDILYLSVTCGKMKNKKHGIETGGYEGTLIALRERVGEYEGQPTLKIEAKMKDNASDQIAVIQFTKEGWFALGFFARIRKIDLKKPFTIGVLQAKENEKMSFCYLKQAGIVKVEADKSFPKYTTVKVSNKDVNDWTAPFAEMDKIIKEINEKIGADKTSDAVDAPTEDGEGDGLPF